MTLIYPRSTDSICQSRSGWVAKIVYDSSDDSGDDGSSGYSFPVNPPQPEYLTESVIDHYEYPANDQAQIDQIEAELAAYPNVYGVEHSAYVGYGAGYFYYYDYYNPDGSPNYTVDDLTAELSLLIPGQNVAIYKTIQVPNPAYNPNQVAPGIDIVLLNNSDRNTQWSYSTYDLYGYHTDGTTSAIPLSQAAASVDFVFCGCGISECACLQNCCVNLAEVAQDVLNFWQTSLV